MKAKKASIGAALVIAACAAIIFTASAFSSPKKIEKQFADSILYSDGKVSFSVPDGKNEWKILIAGRIEVKDLGGMSVHYLEDAVWESGKTYSFETIGNNDGKYTDLILSAAFGDKEFAVDIMPYLPDEIKS